MNTSLTPQSWRLVGRTAAGGLATIYLMWMIYKRYGPKKQDDKQDNQQQQQQHGHKKHHHHQQQPYFTLPSNVKIHVIDSADEADRLMTKLHNSILASLNLPLLGEHMEDVSSPLPQRLIEGDTSVEALDNAVLGLDAEWSHENLHEGSSTPSSSSSHGFGGPRVAIIQLSTRDEAFVFQCLHMDRFPKALAGILNDARILKVGVAISQDAMTIFKNFGTIVMGCVDLVPLAKVTNFAGNGLSSLAMSALNANVDKSHHIRCSHWELKQLTDEQTHYAASDAWLGHAIFERLLQTYRSRVQPPNPSPSAMDFCRPYVNATFKVKDKGNSNGSSSSSGSSNGKIKSTNSFTVPDDRVLYDNCLMFSPEGELLCNVSKKKVAWYVDRGLAEITGDNPLSIKLTFNPKGNGHANDKYYLSNKENKCVVCGTTKKILRHSIVPHSYRQYLPLDVKSHSSHDVVILCCQCHFTMNKRLSIMKLMISNMYNVPIDTTQNYVLDRTILRMSKHAIILYGYYYGDKAKQSAAADKVAKELPPATVMVAVDVDEEVEDESMKSTSTTSTTSTTTTTKTTKTTPYLPKKKPNVPADKLDQMKKEVLEHLEKTELLEEDLIALIESNPKSKNENYVPHEKLVMDKVLAGGDEGIQKFIKQWRKNFVETVQPKYLNEYWNVDR
ncbi:hypothetical protein SAMD00019534_086230 [Acytostelium subglobosum LB1]|uniref:hypothetical protein n=1 Tax=Acytostelium subglobosum LB1 TaxID=1410327 RepID=UPI000644BEAA|nr:hypothetical protein SAMD00019534_086230 [Acytostelium subglobosum LB1]GAM25448.1 hypothetical protein SAMD00019534_086230 [Acytostelium subglobosum LB1]|eukprot:XP_012751434.1 hypothetical protein SAMD00019534_086230 [Acytostelium subglobosum LB1]